ncbi:hypothetical protein ZWY2020_003401, partial [Hordeum vulgare]
PWCWSSEDPTCLVLHASTKRSMMVCRVQYASLQDFALLRPSSSTMCKCHIYLSQSIFVKDLDIYIEHHQLSCFLS